MKLEKIKKLGYNQAQMNNIQITKHKDFEIATAFGKTHFVSWAKMGKIQGVCPITEPGEHVWFNHGATRQEALDNILDELGLKREQNEKFS